MSIRKHDFEGLRIGASNGRGYRCGVAAAASGLYIS